MWVNVEALKKEIVRLKDFYSSARDALSSFHKQLSATKQNDFANEVEELILSKEPGKLCIGLRIKQLQDNLDALERFSNENYDANHSSNNRQHQTTDKIMDELKANCKALTDSSVALIETIGNTTAVTRNIKLQAAIQTVKSFFVDTSANVLETECFSDKGIISSESSENESRLTMNVPGRASASFPGFFNPDSDHRELKTSLVVGGASSRL